MAITKKAPSNCHSILLFGIFTGIPCHLKVLIINYNSLEVPYTYK